MTTDTQTGGVSSVSVAAPARKATMPVSTAMANSQVMTNANALALALLLSSIRTTATIGSGLTITPIAMGRD